MSYARARLWLGITGVGTLVVLSIAIVVSGLPARIFPTSELWSSSDLVAMATFIACTLVVLAPFDFLGGYLLPTRFGRQEPGFAKFFLRWALGVAMQAVFFLAAGLLILAAGRSLGLVGATAVVAGSLLLCLASQRWLAAVNLREVEDGAVRRARIETQLERWGLPKVRLAVLEHADPGFTGGVVGLPGRETVLIPRDWLQTLDDEQLATVVARRAEAIASGGRLRGIAVASGWILLGFLLSASLPGGGVQSVAELVSTCAGFTLWSFLGLLLLPTVSRQAARAIDSSILRRGVSKTLLIGTVSKLDQLQDDEPERSDVVETIFHPLPSVARRADTAEERRPMAWNAARMMLFLSWSCLGVLSRAVHCNAGRPELWVLLPVD